MGDERAWHLGDILSVVTGILVAPDGMVAVAALLDFLTGDQLFTHQLPRAGEVCGPWLRELFPDLAGVDAGEMPAGDVAGWLAGMVARFGERRVVRPLPARRWERREPIGELLGMMGR
jgi:hypothetical protein